MSESQPIVAKSSKRTELEPSVGCDSGTVDHLLNEAPQWYSEEEIHSLCLSEFGACPREFSKWVADNYQKAFEKGHSMGMRLRDGRPG